MTPSSSAQSTPEAATPTISRGSIEVDCHNTLGSRLVSSRLLSRATATPVAYPLVHHGPCIPTSLSAQTSSSSHRARCESKGLDDEVRLLKSSLRAASAEADPVFEHGGQEKRIPREATAHHNVENFSARTRVRRFDSCCLDSAALSLSLDSDRIPFSLLFPDATAITSKPLATARATPAV